VNTEQNREIVSTPLFKSIAITSWSSQMSEKKATRGKRTREEDGGDIEKKRKSNDGKAEATTQQKAPTVEAPTDRPVRVYADGIYDLFHFGHARSLEQAKRLFPNTTLVVGVCNDELTHRLKGKTVMTDKERAESLRHCKWVDEVVEDAPWVVTQDFIDKHKIDFVSHGEDICLDENGVDVYKFVKDQGKYLTIKRTDGISTSDIILRIVKHYDDYVRRNLKRGYTGKQMNVSFMKEKQLQVEDKVNDIKKKFKSSVDAANKWAEQHHIKEFMKKFGGEVEKLVSPFKPRRRISKGDGLGSSSELSSDDEYYYSQESASDVEA